MQFTCDFDLTFMLLECYGLTVDDIEAGNNRKQFTLQPLVSHDNCRSVISIRIERCKITCMRVIESEENDSSGVRTLQFKERWQRSSM